MIPHIHTLFEFISAPYENQRQTLNIKNDRGQIRFREYSIKLLQVCNLLNSSYILACILNLVHMLNYKSRSACGEIIHVRQILTELLQLTLTIFTHFSLSFQLHLHRCMDLNETWQGCYSPTSLEVHVGDNSCSEYFGRVMVLDTYRN